MNICENTIRRSSFAGRIWGGKFWQISPVWSVAVALVAGSAGAFAATEPRSSSDAVGSAVGSPVPSFSENSGQMTVFNSDIEQGFLGAPNSSGRHRTFTESNVASEEFMGPASYNSDEMTWQVLPTGLLYHSYLAGEKEPRFNAIWLTDQNGKRNWETQVGGRLGILRKGTRGAVLPQGWQLDLEGGAQARVMLDEDSDLEAADFRVGILSTHRRGLWSTKFGYYHLSSHIGDEYLIKNPGFVRLNYVRDAVIMGLSRDILIGDRPDVRVYGEYAYALNHEYASPMEIQTGTEYSPLIFNGVRGSPYIAVNGHFRQDQNWGQSGFNVVWGWQWRSMETNHRFRIGAQYYDGPSLQWSFVNIKERLIGWGIWMDY
jgi:hypothetical protein